MLAIIRIVCVVYIIYDCSINSASATERVDNAVISHSGPSFEDEVVSKLLHGSRSKRRADYYNYNNRLRYRRPITQKQSSFLESEHNKYRREVPATNMEYMYYDDQLAASAQRHADRCDFRHSRDRARNVGENIWAAPFSNFDDAVRLWYIERHTCSYCPDTFNHCCGHYTQVVWATTHRLGCGFAQCDSIATVHWRHKYILVCQYAPGGNKIGPTGPLYAFRHHRAGKGSCSECPEHAKRCYHGLCIS